jgi:hypothetical protein
MSSHFKIFILNKKLLPALAISISCLLSLSYLVPGNAWADDTAQNQSNDQSDDQEEENDKPSKQSKKKRHLEGAVEVKENAEKAKFNGKKAAPEAQDDWEPMKGRVNKDEAPFRGNVNQDADALKGNVDQAGDVLKGNISQDALKGQALDPDNGDQELSIEWDRWRNRFLRASQLSVFEYLSTPSSRTYRFDRARGVMTSKFPVGIVAWFTCDVTSDRRIINLKIDKSSGYPDYDQIVFESIQGLEGTKLLRYPPRSRRKVVNMSAGIKTSLTGEQRTFKFGDVERYSVPNR